jgi:hypothetical protein
MFYERESGENSLELLNDGNSMTVWYTSAAAAMRRQGKYQGTPEEFYEEVAFVLPVKSEVPAPDPTTQKEASESS